MVRGPKGVHTMKIAAALFLIAATAALADEAKKEMSAEEKAMMEKYMKAATPGPEHQQMARMAGKWKLQVTSWMKPGAPPMKSEGTSELKPTMGGRYLEEEVHGDMGGQPFEGKGVQGFDNVSKERWGTWVDNMGTGTMLMKGKCAAGAKKCTMKGKAVDPIIGKEVPFTSTMEVKDENSFVVEMTGPGPDGKQFKNLELVYTRAK
jgi:hypothetical protein